MNDSESELDKKIRECDKIKDQNKKLNSKIDVIKEELKTIKSDQHPVEWWLEVIAAGTKPMFDKVDERFNKVDERLDNIDNKLKEHDKSFADLKKGQIKIAGEPPESLYK